MRPDNTAVRVADALSLGIHHPADRPARSAQTSTDAVDVDTKAVDSPLPLFEASEHWKELSILDVDGAYKTVDRSTETVHGSTDGVHPCTLSEHA